MPVDDLPPSLQESILAALLFDERSGAAIAAQVRPAIFDEGYREIAEKALDYRRRYRKAPGRAHLDDLFGKLLQPGRAPRLRRIVFDLAELAADGQFNAEYIQTQTEEMVRQQHFKAALVEANSRFEQGGEGLANDIEAVFSAAVRHRTQTLEAGTFLNDTKRSLKFFDRQDSGLTLGIKPLDDMGIAIAPKEQLLYIGPKGSGKTWFCTHVGVQAILQGERVLHVSLEMDEPYITARYYQRLFAAAHRPDKFNRTVLSFDKLGRVSGFKTRMIAPRWDFSNPGAKRELLRRLKPWGARLGNLVVKYFPSGSLTMSALEGYIDYLELEQKFVPTVLIVDYPDLMQIDAKNLRISMGRVFVDLRGIAGKRNLKLITPTQSGRDTIGGKNTRSKDVTEDISKVFTADQTLTFQRTAEEKLLGTGRLSLEHARMTGDGAEILITQSYSTGQYVLQSAFMQKAYWDKLQEVSGERSSDDDDD
jgi:hypothetical protein